MLDGRRGGRQLERDPHGYADFFQCGLRVLYGQRRQLCDRQRGQLDELLRLQRQQRERQLLFRKVRHRRHGEQYRVRRDELGSVQRRSRKQHLRLERLLLRIQRLCVLRQPRRRGRCGRARRRRLLYRRRQLLRYTRMGHLLRLSRFAEHGRGEQRRLHRFGHHPQRRIQGRVHRVYPRPQPRHALDGQRR